jgi:hypothetical protein
MSLSIRFEMWGFACRGDARCLISRLYHKAHKMAKGSTSKSGGTSKVKIFYMEADLQEGEITQVTQMIQNALGGRPAVQRLNGPAAPRSLPALVNDVAHTELDSTAEVVDEVEVEDVAAVPAKVKAPRKTRPPNLDNAVKPGEEPTFAAYTSSMNLKSNAKRILAVAGWLYEQRDAMSITGDRAYTCFRFVDWKTAEVDFDQPLRQFKSDKLLEQSTEQKGSGEYSINDLGLKKVAELRSSS